MHVNRVLLSCQSPRTSSGFYSLIYNKNYSYFSRLPEETRRGKLVELAYHVRRASVVLAFGVASLEEVLLHDLFLGRDKS